MGDVPLRGHDRLEEEPGQQLDRTERTFLSDIADKMTRRARTPVLLIRPTEEWRSRRTEFKRLLVNLDGSPGAEKVFGQVNEA